MVMLRQKSGAQRKGRYCTWTERMLRLVEVAMRYLRQMKGHRVGFWYLERAVKIPFLAVRGFRDLTLGGLRVSIQGCDWKLWE